jgi:hypothetical protein
MYADRDYVQRRMERPMRRGDKYPAPFPKHPFYPLWRDFQMALINAVKQAWLIRNQQANKPWRSVMDHTMDMNRDVSGNFYFRVYKIRDGENDWSIKQPVD